MKAYKGAFFKTESGKRVSIEASPLWNGERSPKKQDRQLRHQKESSSEERCSIYTSTRVRHLLVVVPISKWNEKRARGREGAGEATGRQFSLLLESESSCL